MNSSPSRHSSLERNRSVNGICGSAEDIYRQRLDDAYYLRRMRDILLDGTQPRPVFPCQMTQLSECLFIGNQKNAEDIEGLVARGITHVINCAPSRRRASCSESPYPLETGIIGFKVIPAEDKEEYEIIRHFDDALSYLDSVRQSRDRALVHCNMGVNRSGAIAAAFLMVSERRHLLEVIGFLKEKRNIILTNKGFRRQLIRYARSKHLLDPISSDYYVRRSGDFEHLVEQQHAFSTPQLRRCTAEQKPPRSRNGRCRTSVLPGTSVFQGEFAVRSLPRNVARGSNDSDQQWSDPLASASPMTRRSISYMVKELESFDDDSDRRRRARSFHASSRKSIAVDYMAPSSPDTERRHDDIPRLQVQSNLGRQFSSRYNLTIGHPGETENRKSDERRSPPSVHQEGFHRQPSPAKDTKSYLAERRDGGAAKSRYCKQIRQHFTGLINLIRPNVNKNVTSSQTSTPKSNQLSFALPIQNSESKAIRIVRGHQTPPVEAPNTHHHHSPNTPKGHTFYVSTNRIAMSAPRSAFHENITDVPVSHHFSTKLSHVVRVRNESGGEQSNQPQSGSLVLIGTRTLQPRSSASTYGHEQNVQPAADQSASTPRRLRRYVKSKTDSELL